MFARSDLRCTADSPGANGLDRSQTICSYQLLINSARRLHVWLRANSQDARPISILAFGEQARKWIAEARRETVSLGPETGILMPAKSGTIALTPWWSRATIGKPLAIASST